MKLILLILIICFSCQGFGDLELFIKEKYKLDLVECEPIKVEIGWRNAGKERIRVGFNRNPTESNAFYLVINGIEYRDPFKGYRATIEPEAGAKDYLDGWEEIREEVDLRIIGLKAGVYEIKAVVDFTGYGRGYYNGKVESNAIELEIRKPMGIDEEAYKGAEKYIREHYKGEYKRLDFCEILTGEGWGNEFRNILLEHYPTSTYAGWVLLHLQNIGGVIPIREKELIKKKANIIASGLDRKILNPDWDTYKIVEGKKVHTRDLYEKNAFYQEKFISANPDFIFSSNISTSLADGYLYYLGETKKGCYYLELALKLDKWWGYNEREAESMKEGAKFYLEELKRLGVCK